MSDQPHNAIGFHGNSVWSHARAFTLILALLSCLAAAPASAAFDETYRLTAGGFVTDFDTSLRINSRDNSIETEIDLEDDLGFTSSVQSAWIRGYWRMGNRHRLSLLYTPLRRSSGATLGADIDVGGSIIKAGAFVGSSVRTHVFDIEYSYIVYRRSDLELGITAGLYWMNSLIELTAAGEVIFDGETQPEFRSDYQAFQRLVAPLPLIGLTADYEINDSWRVNARARIFDVTISDIDGYIFAANLGAEYFFTRHVGLGASLAAFNLSVRHNGVVFVNTLAYEYTGLQAYMTLKY